MLQQTQVATVIPYYRRFLDRFPTLTALAGAPLDEVLSSWAGLGYYARARNLHRAARIVAARCDGQLPTTFDELIALPGIGRSTAGAVLALSYGRRFAILDGNVKRVLARYHAVEGWSGKASVARSLWNHAERHTPTASVASYTQAIMDFGATVCTRRRPACTLCPVFDSCKAQLRGIQSRLPAPRPKRNRARRAVSSLLILDPKRRVLLERRAEQGVWGGLFSFPELADGESAEHWCLQHLGARTLSVHARELVAHAFTHFDLELLPLQVELAHAPHALMDSDSWLWYNPTRRLDVGVAAPIDVLLRQLKDERQMA